MYKVHDLRLRGRAGEACTIIIVAIVLKSPGSSFEKYNSGEKTHLGHSRLQPGLCWAESPCGLWGRSHLKGLRRRRERSCGDLALLTEVLISSQGQWGTLVSTEWGRNPSSGGTSSQRASLTHDAPAWPVPKTPLD